MVADTMNASPCRRCLRKPLSLVVLQPHESHEMVEHGLIMFLTDTGT